MSERKVALFFPGQASHYVGMGAKLAEKFPAAAHIFQRAEQSVDFPLRSLCFSGPEETLSLTEYQQPCVLAASIAAFAVFCEALEKAGVEVDCAAGHSLGEYSALVAAQSLPLEAAVRLVCARGRLMQQAVAPGIGGMTALMGSGPIDAEGLCRAVTFGEEDGCWPANFNSSGQVVISGHLSALERARERAREFGARRVVPLSVSAPFHSPLMAPAALRFAELLAKQEFSPPVFDVYSNVAAQVHEPDAGAIRTGLIRQMDSPVLFETIGSKIAHRPGGGTGIECGPGKVLAGLMTRIVPGYEIFSLGEPEDLTRIEEALS